MTCSISSVSICGGKIAYAAVGEREPSTSGLIVLGDAAELSVPPGAKPCSGS